MNGSRVLVFALLLCLAPLAALSLGADVAGQERVTSLDDDGGTAEYLSISPDEIDAEGFERGGLDVAGAVGADAGKLRSAYAAESLQRELADAENETERREALRRTADAVDERSSRLESRDRDAIRAYGSNERTGAELFRTLGSVDAESEALLEVVRELHAAHEESADSPLTERELATYRARLDPMTGPVRERITIASTGDRPVEIYLKTREDTVTLATVTDDDQYVREAHAPSNRDLDGQDRLGFAGAEERFEELYPWVANNNTGLNTWVVGGQPYLHHADVYAVTAAHPHGVGSPDDLTTYIDGTTTDVFHESQKQNPEALPTRSLVSEDEGLELHLNWTRAGGPMAVALVDGETGEELDATVEVNDRYAGSTGNDRLWTIAPRGTVVVVATHDEGEVETQVVVR